LLNQLIQITFSYWTSAHRNDLSTSTIGTTFQKYSKEQKKLLSSMKLLKFNEKHMKNTTIKDRQLCITILATHNKRIDYAALKRTSTSSR